MGKEIIKKTISNASIQKSNTLGFVVLVLILLLVNFISTRYNKKIDVTEESRFTLTPNTKKLIKNINDIVVIKVFLKGNFPSGFKKLSESTRDVLESFQEVNHANIKYEFVNPLEGIKEEDKNKTYEELAKKGIQGINLQVQLDENETKSESIVFPSALISYNGKEKGVNLLESHLGMSPIERLNLSESMIEYNLANGIKSLMKADKPYIAYITGQGEPLGMQTIDALSTLSTYYKLDTIDITKDVQISASYNAIIICKPQIAFDEKDKFKIDQYIMKGGRVLWLIDQINCNLDTLRKIENYAAIDNNLNLDDMLFKYGVRINPTLVEDLRCNPIPVTVGQVSNSPDIRLLPWVYFPLLFAETKHPIAHNLDGVLSFFPSHVDTIENGTNKKTILLQSSGYSRFINTPATITLGNLRFKPKPEMFNKKALPISVLIEGNFNSLYTNRVDPSFMAVYNDSLKLKFADKTSKPNKMIVVADGDIMLNDYSEKKGPYELGYYKFTEQRHANKNFILNCMEYLTDDDGLLAARSKDIKLRLLDRKKIKNNRLKYQIINIALPIILLLIFASGYLFFRKKKFEGKV